MQSGGLMRQTAAPVQYGEYQPPVVGQPQTVSSLSSTIITVHGSASYCNGHQGLDRKLAFLDNR